MRGIILLALIVSLPFVIADSLQIQMLSGRDKVNGYARSNDELTLSLLASIDGDNAVTTDQVRISIGAATVFPHSCEEKEGMFLCRYAEPIINRRGASTYGVILMDDLGESLLQAGQSLVVDDSPPIVLEFSVNTAGGVGTIFYNIQDGSDTNSCSGIRKVSFTIADKVVAERAFEHETCTLQEAFAFEYDENGEADLCVSAVDYLGQKTGLCRKIIIDTEPPVLKDASMYKNGAPVSFVGREGETVSFGVTIEDLSGISKENVLVNVEKITGKTGDVRISDRVANSTFFVDNLAVNSNSVCEGSMTATDASGHVLQADFKCKLGNDITGSMPVVLRTNFVDLNGDYLLSTKNPKIIAEIFENESGISGQNVFLNLFSITGESKKQADRCVQTRQGFWQCEWSSLVVRGKGLQTIELLELSTDNAGTMFTGNLKRDIEVSSVGIGISDLQISPKNPLDSDVILFSFFVAPLEITPSVLVNASAISRSVMQKAQCEPSAEKWQCRVRIADLKPAEDARVEFVLKDEQGNAIIEAYPVTVFEAYPVQQKFFRFVGVNINPMLGIDRRTATKTSVPVSVQPVLFSDKGVEILSQTVRCDETLLSERPIILNEKSKSPVVLLKFDSSVAEQKQDKISTNCAISIIAKKGRTVFTSPEIINFTAKIPLYNNPLGTIDEIVQKKLDAANNHIKSIEKEIRSWEDANRALGITAGIAQTLAQADAASRILHGILSVVSQVLIITGNTLSNAGQPAGAVLIALGMGVWGGCNAQASIHRLLLLSVWMPGPPTANNPLFKMASFVNSCQLCRHSGEYTLPFEKLTGQIIANIDGKTGKPTSTGNFMQYLWEPQKSIHVASLCLCPQGIEYNLKKERQLACIYRNCIKESAKKGLPITGCDRTYKEQNCVYIDSAGWKVGGSAKLARAFAAMSLTTIVEKIPEIIGGLAWQIGCHPVFGLMSSAYTCSTYPYGATTEIAIKNMVLAAASASVISGAGASPAAALEAAVTAKVASEGTSVEEIVCGLTSAPAMLQETDFLQGNQFNWNQYSAELTGVDYCAG